MNTKLSTPVKSLLCVGAFVFLISCNAIGNSGLSNIARYDYLTLKIETDRSWAKVGESVQIRLTVTNNWNQVYTIESKAQPVLDLVVEDAASNQILLSWVKQNPDQASHHVEWKPGESIILEMVWTPSQEEYGRVHHISGLLSEGSKYVQGASILFYVGVSGP